MAYHLHLFAKETERLPETVDLRIERYGGVEVPYVIETVCGVGYLGRCRRIPLPPHFLCVHAVCKAYRGGDVDIREQRECRRDRYAVLHAVAPVLYERLLEKHVLLRCKRVLELSGVGHAYLLIPFFGSHGMLALEGEGLRHGNIDVRERNRQRGVLRALRHVKRRGERPF